MPNRRRGEVGLELGGEGYTLCLTLGALAELEEAFGAPDLQALATRFAGGRLSGRDLIKLLGVALRGGGHDLSDNEVAALPLERGVEPVVEALTDCLLLTFGAAENPPLPQDA
jgi:Phage tail tube protein, GTA-gp10